MDPVMMLVIVAIIVAILLVEFNKQQNTKHADGSHADVQQLYLLKAAEYKIEVIEDLQKHNTIINNTMHYNIEQELTSLTSAFEKGDIPLTELNIRLDNLLNNLNINSTSLAQAS